MEDPDLALALELADAADALGTRSFGAGRRERKADGSAVSAVDREIEATLRARLAASRPEDAVLGEEDGQAGDPCAPRRWIIDPLDGTEYYLRGIPIWATMLALEDREGVRAAVVSTPALGRRWWALRGHGARCNGVELRVSGVRALGRSFVGHANLLWPEPAEDVAAGMRRALRKASLSGGFESFTAAMLVAAGAIDAALTPVGRRWDHAPVSLIVREAGGSVSGFDGRPDPPEGPLLASNGWLHGQLLEALSGT